jgi:hypothetical protein
LKHIIRGCLTRMKRTDVAAILLGILAFLFFLPFAYLSIGVFVFIFLVLRGSPTNGIAAGAGGLAFALSLRRILFLIVFLVCLPVVISWIGRKISKTRP